MEHFADLPDEEVQKIVFEVGMLGTKGFEINDPEQQYELRSMPGKFSGMQMVCIMYVAGRLHHKSLSEQHLLQVGVVPTGGEAFVLHADLQRVIVLQKAQRRATEDAEVGVGVAKTNA